MITKVSSCILYDENGREVITKVSRVGEKLSLRLAVVYCYLGYLVTHHHGNWVSFLIFESETQKSLVYTLLEVSEEARFL